MPVGARLQVGLAPILYFSKVRCNPLVGSVRIRCASGLPDSLRAQRWAALGDDLVVTGLACNAQARGGVLYRISVRMMSRLELRM
ncbi:MAG: hypothetical protein A2Z37_17385 [Chloroflexi bacterium RBG_19FT_COMBO_62_14]|nr:MAG: hypothetical protein A2Z37_17385 [Chloroflexi bacterium RBG_19FT_COMBO_62_14]